MLIIDCIDWVVYLSAKWCKSNLENFEHSVDKIGARLCRGRFSSTVCALFGLVRTDWIGGTRKKKLKCYEFLGKFSFCCPIIQSIRTSPNETLSIGKIGPRSVPIPGHVSTSCLWGKAYKISLKLQGFYRRGTHCLFWESIRPWQEGGGERVRSVIPTIWRLQKIYQPCLRIQPATKQPFAFF